MDNLHPDQLQKLQELLDQKKFDEAKIVLRGILNRELTEEERGAIITGAITSYIEASNNVNREYVKNLEETIKILKDLKSTKNKTTDAIKIAEIRDELKS